MPGHKDPIGATIRNLFDLQRIANGLERETRAAVQQLINDILAELMRNDPTAVAADRYVRARIAKIQERIAPLIGAQLDTLRKDLRDQLARLGRQQSMWASDQLLGEVALGGENVVEITAKGLTINYFKSVLDTDPFQGHTFSQWFKITDQNVQRRVTAAIQLGMANNETIDQITRRIRGRSVGGGRFEGGVMAATTREASTVARTAVNFIANTSHFETYSQNADVAPKYRYTATLDSRTSDICRSLDGQQYKYGEGPTPPQHPNCRSVITPVVDWEGLGLEPPPEGTRASADGQVPSSQSYEEWLRSQSAATQRDILGASRYELFKDGKVTLRDMVKRDGSTVTVEELERRYG